MTATPTATPGAAPTATPGAAPAAEPVGAASAGGRHGQRPRRRAAVTGGAVIVVVALAAAGSAAAGIGPLGTRPASGAGTTSPDSAAATSLATVTRRTLSDQTRDDGTLGYAGSYSVVNQSPGTYTALPAVGRVITPGQVLYRVSGNPVVLLRGSVPAYRALSRGLTGDDVRELNAALVALGYASSDELDPTATKFSAATGTALKKLQVALDLDETGVLALGQAVFLPGPTRITSVPVTLGTPAGPGSVALQASSTTREVTIDLNAAEQDEFPKGGKVTITMPDGRTTPGVVSAVSQVATKPADNSDSSSSDPTVTITITPTRPRDTGSQDQTTVTVSIISRRVPNALTVPVNALLALAGGGYAVEVDRAGSRQLVPVQVGLFDDDAGLVQVTGAGVAAGQHVVVPAS
ncbi:MAG: hypothetical protein V7637_6685 [Mycobacteriales bacterium]